MLIDAKIVGGDVERAFVVGQELEGEDAETQVGLGHAEVIEGSPAAEEAPEVLATQAALDHAQALGVDIATIKGTGKDGKVTKGDVEAAVAAKESQ